MSKRKSSPPQPKRGRFAPAAGLASPVPAGASAPSPLVTMCGEFEPQEAVLIGCAQLTRNFPQVFVNLIRAIHRHVRVVCLVNEEDEHLTRVLLAAADLPRGAVEFIRLPAVSMWARDWCPVSAYDEEGKRRFVAFELRHLRTSAHAGVHPELERVFGSPVEQAPLTNEGGNLLCNGAGLCLTSTTVMLKNAGRGYDVARVGEVLRTWFGAAQWAYLDPLSGESTGHVDLFCTFLAPDLVAVGRCDPARDDVNAALLDRAAEVLATVRGPGGSPLRVARVPMPPPVDGRYRSYTNLLFANGAVVVPLYPDIDEKLDREALATYRDLLPDREVIGVDILELSTLGGGLHCLTSHVGLARRDARRELPALRPGDEPPVESAGILRG